MCVCLCECACARVSLSERERERVCHNNLKRKHSTNEKVVASDIEIYQTQKKRVGAQCVEQTSFKSAQKDAAEGDIKN